MRPSSQGRDDECERPKPVKGCHAERPVKGCHAERSEASRWPARQMLSAAKHDNPLPILLVNVHHRVLLAVEQGHPDAMNRVPTTVSGPLV